MHHVYLLVLLIAVVIYFALLGLLWLHQERIVFQPPPSLAALPLRSSGSDRVRQVSYRAEDDTPLFGFVVGDADRAVQLLIAFHGNGDLARLLIAWARAVARVGNVWVLLPELRGSDGLPGRPTYVGAGRDARAARRFIAEGLSVP